ncbi:MAG: YidC/Oxa1 family membrane protein insertase, partial [Oscillospiraceae bacterium]
NAISIATPIMGEQFMMKSYSKELCVLSAINNNPAPLFEGLGEAHAAAISNFDFSMFGLFMGDMPTLTPGDKPWGLYFALLLIPILSGLTSIWMSKVTQASVPQSGDAAAAGMNRSMMLMMPLMSVWISFVVPAGVGIYWLISNVLSAIQSVILNKYMNPAEEAKKAAAEAEARYQAERQEKIEAKKLAREQKAQGIFVENEEGLSQKDQNRRKLAEARRRDAEKYGEEYHED